MSQGLILGFMENVINPIIDARMRAMGEIGKAEAVANCPVDTGKLRDSIDYIYDQTSRVLTLYADQPYAAFVELGWRTRSGRVVPGRHFLASGLGAMGKVWGASVEVQVPTLAPKYAERTIRFTGGKVKKARLRVFHRPPARR